MVDKKQLLSIDEAYDVMYDYFEEYYQATDAGDVACLLTGMSLMGDETPLDSALWEDWIDAISAIKGNKPINAAHDKLSHDEAYAAMIKYLYDYIERGDSEDIRTFLKAMNHNDWAASIERVLTTIPRARPYLVLFPPSGSQRE